jgi:hypothetical protein
MRIEPVAAQRDEEIARLQRPRVGHDVPDLAPPITGPNQAADRLGDPAQAQSEVYITGPTAGITQPAT